jgi:hypothetical protein
VDKLGKIKLHFFVSVVRDPRFFNYLIMTLYVLNAARWACAGKWADCAYWASAFCITATVTWGYRH